MTLFDIRGIMLPKFAASQLFKMFCEWPRYRLDLWFFILSAIEIWLHWIACGLKTVACQYFDEEFKLQHVWFKMAKLQGTFGFYFNALATQATLVFEGLLYLQCHLQTISVHRIHSSRSTFYYPNLCPLSFCAAVRLSLHLGNEWQATDL